MISEEKTDDTKERHKKNYKYTYLEGKTKNKEFNLHRYINLTLRINHKNILTSSP